MVARSAGTQAPPWWIEMAMAPKYDGDLYPRGERSGSDGRAQSAGSVGKLGISNAGVGMSAGGECVCGGGRRVVVGERSVDIGYWIVDLKK